jgi:hypothetical protein
MFVERRKRMSAKRTTTVLIAVLVGLGVGNARAQTNADGRGCHGSE